MRFEKAYIYEQGAYCTYCRVYGYDMDTVKEMARNGWKLCGTYRMFLVFMLDY